MACISLVLINIRLFPVAMGVIALLMVIAGVEAPVDTSLEAGNTQIEAIFPTIRTHTRGHITPGYVTSRGQWSASGGWRYDARSAQGDHPSRRNTGNAQMNLDEIYVKTELGTQELIERRMGLAIDVRRLLILVDGKHTVAQILARGRAFHADSAAFEDLERAGLVARLFGARSTEQAESEPVERSANEVQRFLDAQKALSAAINEHLGFRGYGLMMRLQKTENLRDLHEMLPDFAQSLVKRKGMDAATPIVSALEQMIVRKA